MTDKIAAAAWAVAPLDEIVAITCNGSPPAIHGPEDGAACRRPFLFAEIALAEREGADAVIIACLDDPALDEARASAGIPALGIGQAGFHAARLLGQRVSVVTTLPVAIR